jgi:hypothetical protein
MRNYQDILNSISTSRWARPPAGKFMQYYGNKESSNFGLFVPGIERFILVDCLDLWSVLHTAKLLSSKFQSLVFPLNNETYIDLHTSLNYGIVRNIGFPTINQTPLLKERLMPEDIVHLGPPVDRLNDLEQLIKEQEYCYFALKMVQAVRIIDALYTNLDNRFYVRFFDLNLDNNEDESGVRNGITTAIEKIVYFSSDIIEALQKLDDLFNKDVQKPYTMKIYKDKLFELLKHAS